MFGAAMPDEKLSGPMFIAVGEDGLRAFSRDGREWINRQTGKDGEIFSATCFGKGRCVVAGRYGGMNHFSTTTDAITWQPSEHDAKYANYVRNVIFFRDNFLLIAGNSGEEKPFTMSSTDGSHWSAPVVIDNEKQPHGNALLRRFAIGNDLLVGVGDFGRKSVTHDGVRWTNAKDFKPLDTLIDVTFGNGVFVGGGMHGLRMRSTDGLVWTDRVVGEEGEHINAIVFDGKQFVGIGQGATYVSPDGKAWERKPNTNAPTTATFGGSVYLGSLWQGRIMRSTDGITWEQVIQLPQHVYAIVYGEMGTTS